MLTNCHECGLQVSDKALSCPHCGYPIKGENKPRLKRKNKRRRLPNGFGQITEIKGRNLRKPFRAMVTVGKAESGRPICKPLKPEAYFETYNDAYAALVEYNKNPYDLSSSITMAELFENWSEKHFKTIEENSAKAINVSWKYCSNIYDLRVKEVRIHHLKDCMENGIAVIKGVEYKPNARMQHKIKSLFNMLFDYAVEYEIVDRNIARNFAVSDEVQKEIKKTKKDHMIYTDEEIKILWDNAELKPYIDMVLIQCYSGWRPQELCNLEIKNVDIENWTFSGGSKTEAGKDRIVPIHTKIRPIVMRHYKRAQTLGSEYLFNSFDLKYAKKEKKMTYNKLNYVFEKLKIELNLDPKHKLHDGRKHFTTMAKKYNVDEYAIKYIVGHTITDLTERVYTNREIKWLADEIEKIK